MSTVDPPLPSGPVGPPRPGVVRLMLQPHNAKSALMVSLVVGTVLNVVNNGEQIWMHHTVNLWHVGMNFFVPYCVSSYSAARNEARLLGDG